MNEIYIDPQVRALREMHSDLLNSGFTNSCIRERLMIQANSILLEHGAGNEAVVFHLACWCPEFIGLKSEQIMSSNLSLGQSLETIAREHGFESWAAVEAVQGIMLDEEFEKTVEAVINGELSELKKRLDINPELVTQRSQYGHRATLMHYLGANGIESYRQITPLNAPEIARCLISAGADVQAKAEIYGGSTTLDLVLTSAHPHNAGVAQSIAEVLKSAA